jgi:hypothetical protein
MQDCRATQLEKFVGLVESSFTDNEAEKAVEVMRLIMDKRERGETPTPEVINATGVSGPALRNLATAIKLKLPSANQGAEAS